MEDERDMRNLGELDLNLLVVFKYLMQEHSVAGAAKSSASPRRR